MPAPQATMTHTKIPADLQLAEDHFMATRVARPIKTKGRQNIDDASGLPVENELVPVWCDLSDLNFLSPGYPMYFQFLKFAIYILLTISFFSGIYNYTTSEQGTNCIEPEMVPDNVSYDQIINICVKDGINEFSLANKINDKYALEKQEIYNLFTIVLLFFLLQFLRKIQKETAVVCDERDITASDYTIRVANFPLDWDDKVDIDDVVKKYFIENGLPGTKLNVVNVSCTYDVSDKESRNKAIHDKITKSKNCSPKRMKLEAEIQKLRNETQQLSKQYQEGVGLNAKFRGEAFVTLETQREVQQVLAYWQFSLYKSILEHLNPVSKYKFHGKLLHVSQAPEPSDIMWANAGLDPLIKYARRALTAVGTGIVIVFFAYLILLVNNSKIDYLKNIKEDKEKGLGEESQFMISLISTGASIAIVVVNNLLGIILKRFAEFEKYGSSTDYMKYFATRLAFAQFMNTSMVTLGISMHVGNIWGPGGLISVIYKVHSYNAILPLITDFLGISGHVKAFKRQQIRNDPSRAKLMTQEELNALFEYPPFDFTAKYAGYIKTIWSAAFFAPLVPGVLWWAAGGLFFNYWIDKYHMLRNRSRGVSYGSELPIYLLEFLEIPLVLFAVGNFFFNTFITGFDVDQNFLCMLGFILAFINMILPMEEINTWLFPIKAEDITEDKYSQMRLNFVEDYDRSNPATSEIAIEKFTREKENQV